MSSINSYRKPYLFYSKKNEKEIIYSSFFKKGYNFDMAKNGWLFITLYRLIIFIFLVLTIYYITLVGLLQRCDKKKKIVILNFSREKE